MKLSENVESRSIVVFVKQTNFIIVYDVVFILTS